MANVLMKDGGDSIQLPVLKSDNIGRLTAAGAIDVSNARVIVFDFDGDALKLNVGTAADATNYFTIYPGAAFVLSPDVTSVYVSGACGYLLF